MCSLRKVSNSVSKKGAMPRYLLDELSFYAALIPQAQDKNLVSDAFESNDAERRLSAKVFKLKS